MKQTTNFCGCPANPKDSLTSKDYNLIDAYRIYHLNYIDRESADPLFLSFWNEAKKPLYRLLGGQLDLAKTVVFAKPEAEIENELADLLAQHPFARAWNASAAVPQDLLTESRLVDNKVGFSATYNLREGVCRSTTLKVQPNTSLIKTLRKLVSSYLPAEAGSFEDFAKKHSLILNQKELTGTLHLSIHPLDFYTASDNDCGWSSCMNWGYGSYRQGTVEMCNSPYVLVAYLESAEPYTLTSGSSANAEEKFSWNNKKWRQFFIVDIWSEELKLIAPIKGYPYQSKELEESAVNWLLDLASLNLKNPDLIPCTYDANEQTVYLKGTPEIVGTLYFETNYMYNDFYFTNHSLLLAPDYCSRFARTINYSGQAQCMCCGEPLVDEVDEEEAQFLTCETCQPRFWCDCCGSLTTDEPIPSPVNEGEFICSYCSEQVTECDVCGNPQYLQATDFIIDPQKPDRRYCTCQSCQSKYLKEPIWRYDYNYEAASYQVFGFFGFTA